MPKPSFSWIMGELKQCFYYTFFETVYSYLYLELRSNTHHRPNIIFKTETISESELFFFPFYKRNAYKNTP